MWRASINDSYPYFSPNKSAVNGVFNFFIDINFFWKIGGKRKIVFGKLKLEKLSFLNELNRSSYVQNVKIHTVAL